MLSSMQYIIGEKAALVHSGPFWSKVHAWDLLVLFSERAHGGATVPVYVPKVDGRQCYILRSAHIRNKEKFNLTQ